MTGFSLDFPADKSNHFPIYKGRFPKIHLSISRQRLERGNHRFLDCLIDRYGSRNPRFLNKARKGVFMREFRLSSFILIMVALTLLTGGTISAAEYPAKPVTILVGFTAGGPADLSARALAEAAKPFFPKPLAVVNKPGGGSVLATNDMIQSAPDGYTLCNVVTAAVTTSPHLEASLPYKGPEDCQPIISTCYSAAILATRADAPWKTAKELFDYAKANPGKIRVGNAGIGTTTHFHFLSLKFAGVPMSEVPFPGAPQATAAVLGGHIEGIVLAPLMVLPHVKAGKLRIIAMYTEERIKDVPELRDVPTLKELGYKDTLTDGTEYFLAAPKKTPQAIIDLLHDSLLKAEKSEFYQNFARDNVLAVELKGPAQLKTQLEKSFSFYREFIKKTGLKLPPQK